LGLEFHEVATDANGRLDASKLPQDMSNTALVLTAGTTSTGGIDSLELIGRASWSHVDAAWAGPLRLSQKHAVRLQGIEMADSVSVSAHKWFFQPKEFGLIFFRNSQEANDAVSFNGAYLSVPNVGILGSHGATAIPLLAMLLAWGRLGIADRVERSMQAADYLWQRLNDDPRADVYIWTELFWSCRVEA